MFFYLFRTQINPLETISLTSNYYLIGFLSRKYWAHRHIHLFSLWGRCRHQKKRIIVEKMQNCIRICYAISLMIGIVYYYDSFIWLMLFIIAYSVITFIIAIKELLKLLFSISRETITFLVEILSKFIGWRCLFIRILISLKN